MGEPAHPLPLPSDVEDGPRARPLDPRRVSALVPCQREAPDASLVRDIRRRVGDVLLVDDGYPAPDARRVARLAEELGVGLLRLPANVGKGHAVAAGLPPRARHGARAR